MRDAMSIIFCSPDVTRQKLCPKISVKYYMSYKAVSIRIASLGDEHDAIIAVWLHGLRHNEGEE